MEITPESLTKRSSAASADWAGRISRLEANQISQERFSKVEAKLDQFCELLLKVSETAQDTSLRNANANERIASHFEESKRVYQLIEEQGNRIDEQENIIHKLNEAIIELRIQNKQMSDFTSGVTKVAWMVATGGVIVVWWVVQKWLEGAGR